MLLTVYMCKKCDERCILWVPSKAGTILPKQCPYGIESKWETVLEGTIYPYQALVFVQALAKSLEAMEG